MATKMFITLAELFDCCGLSVIHSVSSITQNAVTDIDQMC